MKRVIGLLSLFIILIIGIFILLPRKDIIKTETKNYKVYIEEDGDYVQYNDKKISGKGFVLDTGQSSCSNGATITQNATTGEISVSTTKQDSCNFYIKKASRIAYNKLHSLNNNITVKNNKPDMRFSAPYVNSVTDSGFDSTEQTTSIASANQSQYITYSSSYTLNPTSSKFTLDNPQTCSWSTCYTTLKSGTYYTGQTTLRSQSTNYNYNNVIKIYKISANSTVDSLKYYTNNVPTLTSYNENWDGLFKEEDNYGETIYFRGAIDNNYFKFGKNSSNQDMYWRILRINGDGTIRLAYDGTSAHENTEKSEDRLLDIVKYGNYANDNAYVGYMYGNFTAPSTSYEQAHANEVDSYIKSYLDTWYVNNILNTGYSTYLGDSLFCNERRAEAGKETLAFGQNYLTYQGYQGTLPKYTCPLKNDAFTVDDTTHGNGALTYPIATVTQDDVAFAGGRGTNYNPYFFMNKGYNYWSMTPWSFHVNNYAYMCTIGDNGQLNDTTSVTTANSKRALPVINIKREYVNSIQGTGTKTNPFYIGT